MRQRCKGFACTVMLASGKYCPKCLAKAEAKFRAYSSLYEEGRKKWDEQYRKFYASKEWRAFRLEVLKVSPFCKFGKFASAVHHVVPLKVSWERRLDRTNTETLCASCHSRHELTERNKGDKK